MWLISVIARSYIYNWKYKKNKSKPTSQLYYESVFDRKNMEKYMHNAKIIATDAATKMCQYEILNVLHLNINYCSYLKKIDHPFIFVN